MKRSFVLMLLLLATSLNLACGSSNGRQLQSITINATANGDQIQFVATGTFSAPPTTVTPLPVFWFIDLPPTQYNLTTQPFQFQCNSATPGGGPIVAIAPADPHAPSSGSISGTKMISASAAPTSCP